MKKILKQYTPDIVLYLYKIIQKVPEFLQAQKSNLGKKYEKIYFYTDEETVDMIINHKMSLSRYGDGEFMWMNGEKLDSFQDYSFKLSQALVKSFTCNHPKLLIGIPLGIQNTKFMNCYAKMHWRIVKQKFYINLTKFINFQKKYVNASITRPYIDYRSRSFSEEAFKNIKRIWDKRNIVFVEGKQTKLGIGNDLFNNAKSCKRIICPSINAFNSYEKIKIAIYNYVSKEDLILVALGPTASILSAELCQEGYQIIDIGHIDVEYMWYLKHSILRDSIEGKFVNESGQKDCSDIYDQDEKYLQSIIVRVD